MPEVSETEKTLTKVESDNLSQLVARILNQLAVSAWLPSAALVLAAAFLLQVGIALRVRQEDSAGQSAASAGTSAIGVVATAFSALGETSLGGAVLMIATIVVLTMLTQAFTFEAIRLLEGYWGTSQTAEDWASRRCAYHGDVRAWLDRELKNLTDTAWAETRGQLVAMRRKEPEVTGPYLRVLQARVKGQTKPNVQLSATQESLLSDFQLKDFASRDVFRRRVNVLRRLADYPAAHRVMPTRLGNILRHFEDATGVESIESLVDEVYDSLPGSLQIAHDEQRGRLDLYCSMTVVCLVLMPVGITAVGVGGPAWMLAATASCLLGAGLSYRAAVASARYYGSLLPTIAAFRVAA